MMPQIDLIYNYDYAKRLHQGEASFHDEWQRIIRVGGDFEVIAAELNEKIMELIPRYTGYEWDVEAGQRLPVYVVGAPPSFHAPLTLAVNEEPVAMLDDYIYQLTHHNIQTGFPNDELMLRCLRSVTDHVLEALKLRPAQPKALDLRVKTIRNHLERT